MTHWTEIKVYNESGDTLGTLGELVREGYGWLEYIALDAHGAIDQWQQHMLAVGDEQPDWEVPTGVDWTGFHAALLTAGVQP